MSMNDQFRRSANRGRRLSVPAIATLLLIVLACASALGQGAADEFNPNTDGPIHAIAIQPDGKILIGGDFSSAGGANRLSLARLNPDGSADSAFNPGVGGDNVTSFARVWALAVQPDGKILVGGEFNALGGQMRQGIGRLTTGGDVDSSFNPGADYGVFSLALQSDGKILVGGHFQTLAGQPRQSLGRLNADGSVDANFTSGVQGGESGGEVLSLTVQSDGKILVGGDFTTLGSQTRLGGIGRLNANGTVDPGFNPGTNGFVRSLALQADGKVVVGGGFTRLAGQPRNYIARLNGDGTLDTAFNPGASNRVWTVAVQSDGKILVGGEFEGLAGQVRRHFGRLNPDGTLERAFNPGANSYVSSLAVQADGKIVLGGYFGVLAGQLRNFIGRVYPNGGLPPLTIHRPLTNGAVQLTFQNVSGASYSVVASTNVGISASNWTVLGAPSPAGGGIYQFTDTNAPNFQPRFYLLRGP